MEIVRESDHLGNSGVECAIILKLTINKYSICGVDSTGLGQGPVAGFYKYENRTSGFIRWEIPWPAS